jgi:hypothetical protein
MIKAREKKTADAKKQDEEIESKNKDQAIANSKASFIY